MKEIEKEVWKRIEGFPDYEVSNWGRVKSYRRDKKNGYILKMVPDKNSGYIDVRLVDKSTKKTRRTRIHRLVAETFIPNPENKPEVNHIDENKENNKVDNLEWMTSKENTNHGTHNERVGKSLGNKVRCIETGEVYYSTCEAKRQTGIWNIMAAAVGVRKTAGGFHWELVD